ncbi:MAG: M1 family metallopeptidase [Nocardioides sp.]
MTLRLTAAVAATIALVATGASAVPTEASPGSAPTASARWSAAVSSLHRDTMYPQHGGVVVDALHYGLKLRWQPGTSTLTGHETVTFRAARSASSFTLELLNSLAVSSATLDGTAVTPTHHGSRIRFDSPVKRGTRYVLTLTYAGVPHPVAAPTHRTDFSTLGFTPMPDGSAWTMQEPFGAYTWYAVNDTPADKAFYDFTITAPKGMVGIANGTLRSRRTSGNTTVTRWHLDAPCSSYLTTVAIGDYVHHVARGAAGLPVDLWTQPGKPHQLKVLRYAARAVSFLRRQVGRYPFSTLGIVAVPSNSAMETETMVTMGTKGGVLTHDNVVHEIAHQWYGDTVTPRDWSDLWMNEGMAYYLAEGRWTAHDQHESLDDDFGQSAFYAGFSRRQSGPPAAYDPGDFGEINVYLIPALMWDMLSKKIGQQRFDTLIHQWPAQHRHASSSRAEVIRWWSRKTDRHLAPFFHRWLLAKKEPAWHAG